VATLKLTVPRTVDVAELRHVIVDGLSDRLRDDHGYRRVDEAPRRANEYPLQPRGTIVIDDQRGLLKVKLRNVSVDARDLFTAVSSDLEQRYNGLRAEID
jgi:hypothetical protein